MINKLSTELKAKGYTTHIHTYMCRPYRIDIDGKGVSTHITDGDHSGIPVQRIKLNGETLVVTWKSKTFEFEANNEKA